MDSGLLGGLVAVAAVAILTLVLRAARSSTPTVTPPAPPAEPAPWADDRNVASKPDEEEDEDGDGVDDRLVVAVTSEGFALIPDRHQVLLLPPEEEGEAWKVGAGLKSTTPRAEKALSMSWRAGDLRGARVVRGAADEAPWKLETLGRDGEYIPFRFETSEAAEAAHQLFEHQGIVELGEDEDGRRVPPSDEQFAEARRIYLETEAELGMMGDEEPR
jgi:hypothetical protein